MDRSVNSLIGLIQFAGVAVAFIGVVVAVVRAGLASLAGDRSRHMTTISLDLARTVLIGLDLLLVAAALAVAVAAGKPNFTRLATVAGLRIGLSLLVSFELAFRADTEQDPTCSRADTLARVVPPWEAALRRRFGGAPRRRPGTPAVSERRAHPPRPRPPIRPLRQDGPVERPARAHRADRPDGPGENLWPARARLGRE